MTQHCAYKTSPSWSDRSSPITRWVYSEPWSSNGNMIECIWCWGLVRCAELLKPSVSELFGINDVFVSEVCHQEKCQWRAPLTYVHTHTHTLTFKLPYKHTHTLENKYKHTYLKMSVVGVMWDRDLHPDVTEDSINGRELHADSQRFRAETLMWVSRFH